MQVLLESKNDLDKVENAFGSKEELVDILETAQDNNNTLSPIEVATLQLTMRQIDKGMDLPAIESYRTSPEFFTTLATESLKENIQGKWSAFVKAIKSIFIKIKEMAAKAYERIKSRFKRKAGEKNNKFERETDDSTTGQSEDSAEQNVGAESKTQPVGKIRSYKMPLAYFEFGGESNHESFIQVVEMLPKLADLNAKLDKCHKTKPFVEAALNLEDEEWNKYLQARAQEVLDILVDDYGVQPKGHNADLNLTAHINIRMRLLNFNSYPKLDINKDPEGSLEVPDDFKSFGVKLNKHLKDVIARLKDFYFLSVVDFSTVKDERAQQRLMATVPLMNSRAKFAADTLQFCSSVIDIAESIVADSGASI